MSGGGGTGVLGFFREARAIHKSSRKAHAFGAVDVCFEDGIALAPSREDEPRGLDLGDGPSICSSRIVDHRNQLARNFRPTCFQAAGGREKRRNFGSAPAVRMVEQDQGGSGAKRSSMPFPSHHFELG